MYTRYMRAVMPRILRNAEGQAVKDAQEARAKNVLMGNDRGKTRETWH